MSTTVFIDIFLLSEWPTYLLAGKRAFMNAYWKYSSPVLELLWLGMIKKSTRKQSAPVSSGNGKRETALDVAGLSVPILQQLSCELLKHRASRCGLDEREKNNAYPEICRVLVTIKQILEGDAAICDEIVRRYGGIMKHCQPESHRVLDVVNEIFVPNRVEGLGFRCGSVQVVFVHVDGHVRVDGLIVGLSERHIVSFLKICGPQPTSLAYFHANGSRKHWKLRNGHTNNTKINTAL